MWIVVIIYINDFMCNDICYFGIYYGVIYSKCIGNGY